ncbi:Carboxylesterase [Actinidia chinensis var. chinensis]|uniref:Carboxylesterase n=1 Tax=Actinidia chinensis var. chinensis TaxID=1590841 RepID=A0A2R6RFK4_ACTCC|nr:Carboxylesterase [Actinidia chinensis var. chinensis]
MPGVTVKLYSVLFKFLQKRRLETLIESSLLYRNTAHPFGVTARPDDAVAAVNPTFAAADGVATKDIHIDPQTSLSIRIFLPDTALTANPSKKSSFIDAEKGAYRGYSPAIDRHSRNYRKLPVVLQFHGGGFVSGSSDAVANDLFCRRIAKLLDAIVIAVGYRLAPENRYPAAFEDGVKVLNWLGKQANLANCILGGDFRRLDIRRQQIVDGFGASMVEPWLAAHGDPSRCVLLGVSCGANIANYVAQKAVEAGKLLDPVRVVAQVLMYPFFIGSVPTRSEIRLANSYFYDKAMSILVWKLFLPEKEFDLDHPAANPLLPNRETPLKYMPPTLTVVAEHDWMRDRAIAYSEELRKVNVDAPVLDYKDTVHEFATLDVLLKTPQAQACAEDIAIWVKKYISLRGHEFSY